LVSVGLYLFRISRGTNCLQRTFLVGHSKLEKEAQMGRGLLLWLIGIPIPIILLVWLLGGLH
jgi:hypothetical protein